MAGDQKARVLLLIPYTTCQATACSLSMSGVSMDLVESCARSRATVTVVATLHVGALILTEAILSFPGAGIPPPTPAWGVMITDGQGCMTNAWSVSFFPGLVIVLTGLGLNFMGDWLCDLFDPRLRQLG